MQTNPSITTRLSRNIIILDLRLVSTHLLNELQPVLNEWNLKAFEEDVFDYCICKSFQHFLNLTVKGRILNLPDNDLYRLVYERMHATFDKAIAFVLSNYRVRFLPGSTVKLLSTLEELIVVEYFQT